MTHTRYRLGVFGLICSMMLLGWSAAGCDSANPRRTTFADKTNATCAATNRRVAVFGAPQSLEISHADSAAAYLTRVAAAMNHGLAVACRVVGSPNTKTAELWRDASSLVAAMRAEARALVRRDASGLALARTGADRAWLAASNAAMTNGVTPCGWLVH